MSREELAIANFAQRLSAAHLVVDIGNRLSFGETPSELMLKLRQLKQLFKLFDYEYGNIEGSLELLQKTNIVINTLINNYRLDGTYTVAEVEILPIPLRYANIVIVGGDGSGSASLRQVVLNGNTSEGAIIVNGARGADTNINGLQLFYNDNGIGTIMDVKGSRYVRMEMAAQAISYISYVIGNTTILFTDSHATDSRGIALSVDGSIVASPAQTDDQLATFGQVKSSLGGLSFNYVTAVNKDIEINSVGIKKSILTDDVNIGAMTAIQGMFGKLLLVQDDEGNHVMNYKTNNIGEKIPTNTLPRAVTELNWFKDDVRAWWTVRVLFEGIEPTPIPTIALDNYYFTLEVFDFYDDSEILMSVNGGAWVPYPGKFSVAQINRPAGYWRFKVKEAEGRIESKIASSLPLSAVRTGFAMPLPITLTN